MERNDGRVPSVQPVLRCQRRCASDCNVVQFGAWVKDAGSARQVKPEDSCFPSVRRFRSSSVAGAEGVGLSMALCAKERNPSRKAGQNAQPSAGSADSVDGRMEMRSLLSALRLMVCGRILSMGARRCNRCRQRCVWHCVGRSCQPAHGGIPVLHLAEGCGICERLLARGGAS